MQVVTAGWPYLDIDAYAGIVAYTELLNLQGTKASAISTAPLNESIPPKVIEWGVKLKTFYTPSDEDRFTIIDLSDPEYVDKFVDVTGITEVIDHHVGFEQYWHEKLGDKAHIEFIGAACTLVYEQWRDSRQLSQISETSARLLVCGILDNTLNFGAEVTTLRDKEAYEHLLKYANLSQSWPKEYFEDCERAITNNLKGSLRKDTKFVDFPSFGAGTLGFAQMVVWDAERFLAEYSEAIDEYFAEPTSHWFANVISLKTKQSVFFVSGKKVEAWLAQLLGVSFSGRIAKDTRLWLRKEIIKKEGSSSSNQ